MNQDTINQLKDVFAPVAAKIGQGAQFGWEVVMKQQYVIAIQDIFLAGISLIGIVAICIAIPKLIKRDKEEGGGTGYAFSACMLGVVGGIVSVSSFIACSLSAASHLINPAYYAIDFFINLVK